MMDFLSLKKNLSKDFSSFKKIKIAVLGDSATQFLSQSIKGYGYEVDLNFEIYEADYNQIELQVFDRLSDLYRYQPEYIIIQKSALKLLNNFYKTSVSRKSAFGETELRTVREIYSSISANSKSKIIFTNYNEINDGVFGNFAAKVESSFLYQIRKINLGLMDLAREIKNLYILDTASINSSFGMNKFTDAKMYINADMVYSLDVLPEIAKQIADIITSIQGRIKKCIILDLDNTLWGGIIGDDGIENIQIGSLGIGKAYSNLQLWLRELKYRGIILTVCSKNTESLAKEPFEKHPDMILHLDDIALFVANWDNKVENIKYIQSVLNLGFDSMVFIDDSRFERGMIKQAIPELTVPDLPEDAAEYVPFLRSLNLFETASYSEQDAERTKLYQEEANRTILYKSFSSEQDFLSNLEMVSEVHDFNKFNAPRIAQLTQRSNQFNLRTIRYTEADILKLASSNEHKCFAFTLKDKYGEYGLIGILILEKQNESLFIDSFIMSCRVLKRSMENFILNQIVEYAKGNGFKNIVGEYLPTVKNVIVKDLFKDYQFKESSGRWYLEVDGFVVKETFIKRK